MKLVIVGSARCVWDDLEKIWPIDCDVMAVNDMISYYPESLTYAYSNDFEMLMNWVNARRPPFQSKDKNLSAHCCFPCHSAKKWDIKVHGNSGLCAVYVALQMGYDDITLCGIPQDNTGHFFDAPWERTNYENSSGRKRPGSDQIRYWSSAAENVFKGRVKSMSGRTSELLGKPSERVTEKLRA